MGKKIAFASGSEHKLREVRKILEPLGFEILSVKDLALSFSPDETESTFVGNSFIKSRELYRLTGLPSFADDSGICVEALNNEPGVYSARYGGEGLSDRDRAHLLLTNLRNEKNRRSNYTCSITFVNGQVEESFEGKVFGEITTEYDEAGKNGFGYDPIFYFPDFGQTFSSVSDEKKNSVSHRAIALRKFADWLKANWNLDSE